MPETKEFYTPMKSLMLTLSDGIKYTPDGSRRYLDHEVLVQFNPVGNADNYGRYVTSDPWIINKLEEYRKERPGEILSPMEFMAAVTPDHIKLADLQRQLAAAQAENNRLAGQLKKSA